MGLSLASRRQAPVRVRQIEWRDALSSLLLSQTRHRQLVKMIGENEHFLCSILLYTYRIEVKCNVI